MSKSSSVLATLALCVVPTLAAQAQPVTILPSSLVRVRADNRFGVTKDSVINPPVFSPAPVASTITDTEVGTTTSATSSATYEFSLTGTTAVFDIQTTQSYNIGSAGTLTEGFIQFTTSEPLVYELSGAFTGSSPDDREAYQQRTFLRQFESPFATAFLEDETRVWWFTALHVNQGNDTGSNTNFSVFNQSGPRLGVLPAGTYEFAYELEVYDRDNDMTTGAAAAGRTRLVLRRPLAPTAFRAVTTGQQVALSWTPSLDAATYILQAGSAPGGSDLLSAPIGNVTALQGTVPAGTYYLRLIAANQGAQSPPTEEITFTAGAPACTAPPPVPAAHAVETGGVTAALSWGSSPGATSYVLEAGTASGAADLANFNVGGRTSLTGDVPPRTYFTRIRAANACGTSAPSNEASFSVCSALAVPTLTFTRPPGSVRLAWTPVLGASSYALQVGTSPGASNFFNGNLGPGTSLTFPDTILPTGIYYMRVVAIGPCGAGAPTAEVAVTLP